jgi:hypothetical protein
VLVGSAITIGTNGKIVGRAVAQTAVTCESICTLQVSCLHHGYFLKINTRLRTVWMNLVDYVRVAVSITSKEAARFKGVSTPRFSFSMLIGLD